MGALTDIQDNIEKLRSLQESLHDLCAFISTLDLTSGAKEDTLIHGITELKEAFATIDLSSVELAIAEVKNAVTNIDFSTLAKESTLTQVASKVEEEADSIEAKIDESVNTLSTKIDNIKLPEIDTTELAKESTLNAVSSKLDNLNVEVDLTQVAKQGSNANATNSAILEGINSIFDKFDGHYAVQLKDIIGE